MHGVLTNASLARIPASALGLIGRLRAYASVQVRLEGERAWVRWNEAGFEVLRALLPVENSEFFEQLDAGRWHQCGHSLPAFSIPEDGFVPLASVVVPGAATLHPPGTLQGAPSYRLTLVRSNDSQPATTMLCKPAELAAWANMATLSEIRNLQGARCGDLALVVTSGDTPLPPLPHAERYWGERLLCPLGFKADPDLPASALLHAIGVEDNELALLRPSSVEVIPRAVLRALDRSSIRLGARLE